MHDEQLNQDVQARKEQQHQEDLQRIRGFRMFDNTFMNACLSDNIPGTELILQIVLGKPGLKVNRVETQKLLKNLQGRDIWLDVEAEEADGTKYNIEIQRDDRGAGFKRARYHASMLDSNALRPSDEFDQLPNAYVIFITESDVIGKNKPIYTVERRITNIDEAFEDWQHILYVNGADQNNATELGKLMHDFSCSNPDDMYFEILADRARYFKENEKGVAEMCKVIEDVRNENTKQVMANNIQNLMKNLKLTVEQALDALSVPPTQREMYAKIVGKKSI